MIFLCRLKQEREREEAREREKERERREKEEKERQERERQEKERQLKKERERRLSSSANSFSAERLLSAAGASYAHAPTAAHEPLDLKRYDDRTRLLGMNGGLPEETSHVRQSEYCQFCHET